MVEPQARKNGTPVVVPPEVQAIIDRNVAEWRKDIPPVVTQPRGSNPDAEKLHHGCDCLKNTHTKKGATPWSANGS